jgi:single-stranded-DNA-specific exonuclease
MSALAAVETQEWLGLPPSLVDVLRKRGVKTSEQAKALLEPSLASLGSPDRFPDMAKAVARLREAIETEEPIAIYADRDVDGLTGLAILMRTLRTLGGHVIWASPLQGRGVQRAILEPLLAQKPKIIIFVDCGSGETEALDWLAAQGIQSIVADHHRLSNASQVNSANVFAWVHPGSMDGASEEMPAGCVMAFKLAEALWISFLGREDRERLDYFLFEHLDLLALGILGDRVALTGENRIFVWHGLRRLAQSRKGGMQALLRFFRLVPRSGPITVREASWRIIPMLNAAGRLGRPECAVQLLLTEEPWAAREGIDTLLELNSQRRDAQQKSLEVFDRMVNEQCAIDTDSVLVALADGVEPSVTGLAAQSLVRKYGRPAFLFVTQGAEVVGSARGTSEIDLYAWVEAHRELLIKFGGHQGAVGLTLRRSDFSTFRERIRDAAKRLGPACAEVAPSAEAEISMSELDASWWEQLQRLEPFGPGFPCPVFRLRGIERIRPFTKPRAGSVVRLVLLEGQGQEFLGEFEAGVFFPAEAQSEGAWSILAHAVPARKGESIFKWMIQEVRRSDE